MKLSQYPFSHALPGRASHGDVPGGAAWFDVSRFGPDRLDPILNRLGNELRAVAPREEALSEVMATRAAPK